MDTQSRREEILNTWSHGLGVVLGVIGLVLLLKRVDNSVPFQLLSVCIYGTSIIVLFLASTLYHASHTKRLKKIFRTIDHISIYLLIAGTYTPVLLLKLMDSLGWTLFLWVWSIALFGMVLKLFFTGRFEVFSTLLYLVMGWLIVFDFSTLSNLLHPSGLLWLFAGGLFYTVGIVFYVVEKIPYNHFIWHLFVLGGAISHFVMMYCYVI